MGEPLLLVWAQRGELSSALAPEVMCLESGDTEQFNAASNKLWTYYKVLDKPEYVLLGKRRENAAAMLAISAFMEQYPLALSVKQEVD